MKSRSELLLIAQNDDEKILLSRIIDIARSSEKNYALKTSQFLNGHELVLAQKVLSLLGVCFSAYGGYEDCERKIIACYPEYIEPTFPISVIKVTGRDVSNLSHRDYLGGLLSLGIKREKLGDIVIAASCGYIICMDDISDYIISQVEKIGRVGVKLKLCDFSDIELPEKRFKEIRQTVASLRLDAVISCATGKSRSDALNAIKSGFVTVNWQEVLSPAYEVKQNQVISVKGIGRLELSEIHGTTKKDRIALTIRRYI